MPSIPVILAILTAFSMAAGQMLFKLAATSLQGGSGRDWFFQLLCNPFLLGAVFLYAVTILVWVYILRSLPLSLAYPLTALSYVIVPALSYFFLQEKIGWQMAVGSVVIIVGVVITHLKGV